MKLPNKSFTFHINIFENNKTTEQLYVQFSLNLLGYHSTITRYTNTTVHVDINANKNGLKMKTMLKNILFSDFNFASKQNDVSVNFV